MADSVVKKIAGDEYHVLNLQGKAYAPVNQRVESAHKHGGYSVVSCEYKEIFGKQVCEVWIEIEGKRFPGTAELKKGFDRPLEDAQTSAIGRALGFAGFNVETAIASAEDMASIGAATVEADSEQPRQIQNGAKALPEPKKILALECKNLADALGYSDEQRADLKQQYTSQKGLVSYDAIYAHLQREAKDREMEHLHAALAANPAD